MTQPSSVQGLEGLPHGGEPLPRRHALSREDVRESQRGRLLCAALHIVAEKGYHAATIGDVVERAVVSRKTFYQHFQTKDECFLAAYDNAMKVLTEPFPAFLESAAQGNDWRGPMQEGIQAFLQKLESQPDAARATFLELHSGGEYGQLWMAGRRLFADMFRAVNVIAREQNPALPVREPAVFDLLVGGIGELIRGHLLAHGARGLTELRPVLNQAIFAFFGE